MIHISDDVVLKRNEIIALLDVSTGQVLKQNVEFIKNAETQQDNTYKLKTQDNASDWKQDIHAEYIYKNRCQDSAPAMFDA